MLFKRKNIYEKKFEEIGLWIDAYIETIESELKFDEKLLTVKSMELERRKNLIDKMSSEKRELLTLKSLKKQYDIISKNNY